MTRLSMAMIGTDDSPSLPYRETSPQHIREDMGLGIGGAFVRGPGFKSLVWTGGTLIWMFDTTNGVP